MGSASIRRAVAGVLVALCVAAVAFAVSRAGPGSGGGGAVAVRGAAPTVTYGAGAELGAEGARLVVRVPIDNPGEHDVRVVEVLAVPPGFTPLLPRGGVPVPSGGTGVLPLVWDGPDCGGAVPEHLLPALRLVVWPAPAGDETSGDQGGANLSSEVAVDIAEVDLLLLQTRRGACADEAPPSPADEVDG